jgi:hypothetical protein
MLFEVMLGEAPHFAGAACGLRGLGAPWFVGGRVARLPRRAEDRLTFLGVLRSGEPFDVALAMPA